MKLARHLIGDYPNGYRLLDVDTEQNIPTWYSSTLLLVCAVLLALITLIKMRSDDPYKYHWALLSALFVGLSIDEATSMHEELIELMQAAYNLSGVFYFGWILPALGLLLVLAFVYLRFMLDLSLRSRRLFLLAAGIYVGGAVGVEMINGSILWGSGDVVPPLYSAFTALEEFLEMLGINVFIYALLSYLTENLGVKLLFDKEKF